MWHKSDRVAPTGPEWDDTYVDTGKWYNPDAGMQRRINTALELVGNVTGKTILDLGGGPLLGRGLFARGASRVVLVDISRAACDIAISLCPAVETRVCDALTYLNVAHRFDVTLTLGLLMYCGPNGLDVLFSKAPSDLLVINDSAAEGYLEYKTRVTVYSHEDISNACVRYGWSKVLDLGSREHHFASFRRNNASDSNV